MILGGFGMQPLQLFETAFRQNEWFARRQSVVASNIANVNTPGYKAKDVDPFEFEKVMRSALPMTATNAGHISPDGDAEAAMHETRTAGSDVQASGNDVNLEREFLKTGEISRGYSMNTQILKAFSRMLLSATKV